VLAVAGKNRASAETGGTRTEAGSRIIKGSPALLAADSQVFAEPSPKVSRGDLSLFSMAGYSQCLFWFSICSSLLRRGACAAISSDFQPRNPDRKSSLPCDLVLQLFE